MHAHYSAYPLLVRLSNISLPFGAAGHIDKDLPAFLFSEPRTIFDPTPFILAVLYSGISEAHQRHLK
jgi:hypothetical protein